MRKLIPALIAMIFALPQSPAFAADEARLSPAGQLPAGAVLRLGTARFKFRGGGPATFVFSPDGKRIAIPGSSGVTLYAAATGEAIRTIGSSFRTFGSATFSSDGKLIASGGNKIGVWETDTGKLVLELEGDNYGIMPVAFSPDGKTLATGSEDKTIHLVDIATGKLRAQLKGHKDIVNSLAFSPDGAYLASGEHSFGIGSCGIRLWEMATGKELWSLEGHQQRINAVAFSPDGKLLVSVSEDKVMHLWDLRTGKSIFEQAYGERLHSAAFSPDGALVAVGDYDQTIRLMDVASHAEVRTIRPSLRYVDTLAFSPDGKMLASASANGAGTNIEFWDPQSGAALNRIDGHGGPVTYLAFSSDGKRLATYSQEDPTFLFWELPSGKKIGQINDAAGEIGIFPMAKGFDLSPDQKLFVSCGGYSLPVRIMDTSTGQDRLKRQIDRLGPTAVALSPDAEVLAAGSDRIQLVNAVTGEPIREIEGYKFGATVYDLAFSPDGRRLAAAGNDFFLLWDMVQQKELRKIDGGKGVGFGSVMFLSNGDVLAVTKYYNDYRLWNLTTGKKLKDVPNKEYFFASDAVSPDGRYLAFGGEEDTVLLWDTARGRFLKLFGNAVTGHSPRLPVRPPNPAECRVIEMPTPKPVRPIAFSPDGKQLVSCHSDGTIRLWDVTAQRLVASFLGPIADTVAFSPDGKMLATGCNDSTILLWNLAVALQGEQK